MKNKKFVFHGKQVLLLGLVALVIAAGYYRWTVESGEIASAPAAGDALPVNAGALDGKEGEALEGETDENGGSFEKLKQERDAARSSAAEEWKKVSKDTESSEEQKSEAAKKLKAAGESAEKEKTVETLVKAKGYDDCFAFISDEGVSVTVKGGEISGAKVAQIKDIVVSETGASVKDIKISAK